MLAQSPGFATGEDESVAEGVMRRDADHRLAGRRVTVKTGLYLYAIVLCASGLLVGTGQAQVQDVERDTTITGPRGRTIQRQVDIQRGPGSIDRSVTIKRPGGTLERQTVIQRAPAGRRPMPGPWPRPPWLGPRPVAIVQPAPALGFGLVAAPFMNFSIGGGGGGLGFGGGGGIGGGGGGPVGPGPGAPPPPPPDQVALMCQRLQSFYSGSRKEAAYTLGRLGDPRAVPSLVHVLKYDNFKDVRVAAAIALGEIGGSEAAVALERSSIYDHREDVRKASTTALERLNTKAQALAARMQQQGGMMVPGPGRIAGSRPTVPEAQPPAAGPSYTPPASTPSPFRDRAPDTNSGADVPDLSPPQGDLTPPPPPTPVTSGTGAAPNR